MNLQQELRDLRPEKEFFIGIDSDGCAFDTMEIKHKECFCPNAILHFEMQNISKYVRDAWDFVNLYSKTRGCNRFHALINVFDLLKERKEVKARNPKFYNIEPIREWTKKETKLGNPTLEKYVNDNRDIPELEQALRWSKALLEGVKRALSTVEALF